MNSGRDTGRIGTFVTGVVDNPGGASISGSDSSST